MKNLSYFLLLIASVSFMGCLEDTAESNAVTDSYTSLFLNLMGTEYEIYEKDYKMADEYLSSIEETLKASYNVFCPYEGYRIDAARLSISQLQKKMTSRSRNANLDHLRGIKAQIVLLDTEEYFDPYFHFLWRFEEEMNGATTAAIDPMLGLHEWNEFEEMVNCMNNRWQRVQMNYLSPVTFEYDPIQYKQQISEKINLDAAVKLFNLAVQDEEGIKYDLCESGEYLQKSYYQYIKSMIVHPLDQGTMELASL